MKYWTISIAIDDEAEDRVVETLDAIFEETAGIEGVTDFGTTEGRPWRSPKGRFIRIPQEG